MQVNSTPCFYRVEVMSSHECDGAESSARVLLFWRISVLCFLHADFVRLLVCFVTTHSKSVALRSVDFPGSMRPCWVSGSLFVVRVWRSRTVSRVSAKPTSSEQPGGSQAWSNASTGSINEQLTTPQQNQPRPYRFVCCRRVNARIASIAL